MSKKLLPLGAREALAEEIEDAWEDRDFPTDLWFLSKKPLCIVLTQKIETGLGERMRFHVQHAEFKDFVFYTR